MYHLIVNNFLSTKKTIATQCSFILFLCLCSVSYCLEPCDILFLSFGARQNGMGEIGTSLIDDEAVMFWNPAGLGKENQRWHGGATSYSYEPLLVNFNVEDSRHQIASICFKWPKYDIGGINITFNQYQYSCDPSFPEMAEEYLFGLSYGKQIIKNSRNDHYAGASFKLLKTLRNNIQGKAFTGNVSLKLPFALDIGYLLSLHHGLQFGFTLMNMGPPVYYYYKEKSEPIPFTVNAALGYRKMFHKNKLFISDIAAEYRISRIFVKEYNNKLPDSFIKALFSTAWHDKTAQENLREFSHNFGYEIVFINTLSIRQGVVISEGGPIEQSIIAYGKRRELHFGAGISFLNHCRIDWSYIHSPTYTIERDRQWGLNFSLYNIAFWNKNDKYWWKMKEK